MISIVESEAALFSVEIDWNADGTWIDESSRARRVQIRSGFVRPGDLMAGVGRCTVTLANTDGRFSPGSTSSPLAGKLLPRRALRVRTAGGDVLFRGVIKEIRPDAGRQAARRDCVITAVDAIALMAQQQISVEYQDDIAVDEAVSAVVAAVYTPPAAAYDDNGDHLTHYGRSWAPEQTTAFDALADICRAVYGRFFIARDGTASYRSRTSLQDTSAPAAALGDDPAYWKAVAATRTAHLIGYWRLAESAGATVHDSSGAGRDGAASGVTWGQPGVGDGSAAAGFDGINDYLTLAGASLAAAFDGDEGTLLIWLRVPEDPVWNDGAYRYLARIASATCAIKVFKTPGGVIEVQRSAGGVLKGHSVSGLSGTGWTCLALTWSRSADRQITYRDGAAVGSPHTGLAAWTEVPTLAAFGAYSTSGSSPWYGTLAHIALWDAALGSAELAALAHV